MARKYALQNDELYYRAMDGELKLCLPQFEVPIVLTEFMILPLEGIGVEM